MDDKHRRMLKSGPDAFSSSGVGWRGAAISAATQGRHQHIADDQRPDKARATDQPSRLVRSCAIPPLASETARGRG